MSSTTLTHPAAARTAGQDWYAVDLPPRRHADERATFRAVALALSGPIDDTTRPLHDRVVGNLARANGRPDLAPVATDPDAARHRLAAHVVARFVHEPGHPALLAARRRLAQTA